MYVTPRVISVTAPDYDNVHYDYEQSKVYDNPWGGGSDLHPTFSLNETGFMHYAFLCLGLQTKPDLFSSRVINCLHLHSYPLLFPRHPSPETLLPLPHIAINDHHWTLEISVTPIYRGLILFSVSFSFKFPNSKNYFKNDFYAGKENPFRGLCLVSGERSRLSNTVT